MSELSSVPIRTRRRLALTLGLFAALFGAVGVVAATGSGAAGPVFSVIAFVIAVVLALIAWGMQHSVSIDLAEQRLDRAIEDAIGNSGGLACGCGHDHDPDELHVTDADCSHDGSGAACSHDCQTCVLAALRPLSPPATQ